MSRHWYPYSAARDGAEAAGIEVLESWQNHPETECWVALGRVRATGQPACVAYRHKTGKVTVMADVHTPGDVGQVRQGAPEGRVP